MAHRKMGRKMSILRQPAKQTQDQNGTRKRHRIASGRIEGKKAVYSRLTGAVLRAVLVILMIVTPSALLSDAGFDTIQVVTLVALFAAIFTIAEYSTTSPSLVEFRDAPPFNRVRFSALFGSVFALSIIFRGAEDPSTFTQFFQVIGERIGASIDFPYSPVRLMIVMMPDNTDAATLTSLRTAAGLSYFISLISLAVFVVLLHRNRWPRRNGQFNVWVNLPTFDPTAGGDVVERLNRDSQVNLILGFLLPFMIPAVLKFTGNIISPLSFQDPQTLIWAVTAWAFLPASLLMRGVALNRVAQMIYLQRKKAYAAAVKKGMQLA